MLGATSKGTAAVLGGLRPARHRSGLHAAVSYRHRQQTSQQSTAHHSASAAPGAASVPTLVAGALRGGSKLTGRPQRSYGVPSIPREHGIICRGTASDERQRVLLISPLWPEASSSAAGVRTMGLIESFLGWGWEVSYLSPAARNEHTELLDQKSVTTHSMKPNRSEELKSLLEELNPTVCMFDRFYAEEAFSFVVRDTCPSALRILDIQDLHFLRNGRHDCLKANMDGGTSIQNVMKCVPSTESDLLLRELAALHRSDLNIMCSPVEIALLEQRYQISPSKLALSSFHYPPPRREANPDHHSRAHFMTIGNFKHPPNMDSVRWLATEVWGPIRDGLRTQGVEAEMHVYGAYPSAEAIQLHKPSKGFHVLGHAPSLEIMRQYRVCLCPIRFGAGLKGKVLDSWLYGLPVCTTPVAAEGLFAGGFPAQGTLESWLEADLPGRVRQDQREGTAQPWGGTWTATCTEEVVQDAIELYTDEEFWTRSQEAGYDLLEDLFAAEQNAQTLKEEIMGALQGLEERRRGDFVGAMLWHQGNRATEYFSRWIELKETGASPRPAAPLQ